MKQLLRKEIFEQVQKQLPHIKIKVENRKNIS